MRREGEDFAAGHVGRVHDQVGLAGLVQVGEGLAVEELAVEELLDEFAARRAGEGEAEPGDGAGGIEREGLRVVGREEVRLEAVQPLRAVEREVRGDDAAAGDGRDHRDVVDQRARRAVGQGIAIVAQFAQHGPAERGGARAAARDREQDQRPILRRFDDAALGVVLPCGQRLIAEMGRRATLDQQRGGGCDDDVQEATHS